MLATGERGRPATPYTHLPLEVSVLDAETAHVGRQVGAQRYKRYADVGREQADDIGFAARLMTLQVREPTLLQKSLDVFEALAMRPTNDPFAAKLPQRDPRAIGVAMGLAHGEHERLREKDPAVEPFPFVFQGTREAEIGAAPPELVCSLRGRAAGQPELHAGEAARELGQLRKEDRNIDRRRQRELERGDGAAFERVRERLRRGCAVETLLHERQHLGSELREMGQSAFPLEQFAPELRFKRLDRPSEGGLRNGAFLRRPREVQRSGRGQKVPDLMHLHRVT